ncbi:MAG: uncharacterized protein KVP18_004337 [Porospora cf. gigantea A]|uniref:uncharacterized protein n=1 Tax=Porospora cf. gigantea A TaxID=2853593 RepID=UPI00355A0B1C|nr:MAG: hypothetical protein KVP18_004337 [Porospora cf. gigantea A]
MLVNPRILLSGRERDLFRTLKAHHQEHAELGRPRVVGGWVRDKLLGLEPADVDIATETDPAIYARSVHDFLFRTAQKRTQGYRVVPETKNKPVKIAILRICGFFIDVVQYRGGSYGNDKESRDFTVNCMYYDIVGDYVLDPSERGLRDLSYGVLRTVLPPAQCFQQNSAHVLRAIRIYATRSFYLDSQLFRELKATGAEIMENICSYRWYTEWDKCWEREGGRLCGIVALLGLSSCFFDTDDDCFAYRASLNIFSLKSILKDSLRLSAVLPHRFYMKSPKIQDILGPDHVVKLANLRYAVLLEPWASTDTDSETRKWILRRYSKRVRRLSKPSPTSACVSTVIKLSNGPMRLRKALQSVRSPTAPSWRQLREEYNGESWDQMMLVYAATCGTPTLPAASCRSGPLPVSCHSLHAKCMEQNLWDPKVEVYNVSVPPIQWSASDITFPRDLRLVQDLVAREKDVLVVEPDRPANPPLPRPVKELFADVEFPPLSSQWGRF